jgi:VPDSG-CTERM motif
MRRILSLVFGLVLVVGVSRAGATDIDLTTQFATGTLTGVTGGTALFEQGPSGAGTGIFPAFVQIGSNDTQNEAYNTTVNNVNDNGPSDQHNHEITFAELQATQVTRNGVTYYQFVLDVNESAGGGNEFVSLDDIRVLTSTTANQSSTPFPTGTLRWDMNDADHVLLDFTVQAGSGFGDMRFLVPTAAFAGALSTDFVYLYSHFGELGVVSARNYGTSDGFEEWAILPGTSSVPDGGLTAGMLGMAMLGVGMLRRKLGR